MSTRVAWGAALWLLRPAYIAVELLVAAQTTGGYQVTHDTVSALGATACTPHLCSPWRDLMNGTFVVTGLLLTVGAVLLAGRLGLTVTALLGIAGLSSVATGLAPVDEGATLHALAAAPLFVCQPIALVLLARRSRSGTGLLPAALLVAGVGTGAAAVAFVAGVPGSGVWERLALWPPLLMLAVVAGLAHAQSWPSRRSSASSSVPS